MSNKASPAGPAGDVMWPAYYMAAPTALGLIAMALMRETAPALAAPSPLREAPQ